MVDFGPAQYIDPMGEFACNILINTLYIYFKWISTLHVVCFKSIIKSKNFWL